MAKSAIDWIALVLVIIGGLNWGLVAIKPTWDLVILVAGEYNLFAQIIYGLVGLSALWMIYFATKE